MLNRIPESEIKNADEFLTPITQENPCGPYVRRDPVLTRLKELRAIVTDTSSGPWKPKEKLGDTVAESIQLSEDFLKKTSKDLTVAAYYTEALTKKYGFFGLDQGLSVIYALCETYWDKVNPDLSAENAPLRITTFKLLQKILMEQLNFAPIVITANNEQLHVLDILKKDKGHEPTKVKNKIISALAKEKSDDLNFFKEKLQNSIKILNVLNVRSEELDKLLETQEAPNFSKQVEILKLVLELVNSALNPQALQLAESAILGGAQMPEEGEIKDFTVNDNSIKSIQDAYKMIEKINEYLLKNDSHSPCPALIKRATEWRKKDIFELYADIFASISRPDELFALLALKPKPQAGAPESTGTPPTALPPSSVSPMGGYPPAGGGYESGGYPPAAPASPYGGTTPPAPGGGYGGNPYGGGGNPYGGGGGGGYGGGNPFGSGGGFG